MSSTIVRDPDAAKPWPPAPLRSSTSEGESLLPAGGSEGASLLDLASVEAEALLRQARLEAEELVRAAREEAERLQAAALVQGRDAAREECEKEKARLAEMARQIAGAYQAFCLQQIPALADLATLAAGRLLVGQINAQPEHVIAIVRTAMEQVLGATQITLRLNPGDVDLVQNEFLSHPAGHGPTVRIVPDPAVERGGCWIDSEQGKVDASVSGRLARLESAMRDG